jgi:hypothetical protein
MNIFSKIYNTIKRDKTSPSMNPSTPSAFTNPGGMYQYNQFYFSPMQAQLKFMSWVSAFANLNAYTTTRVRPKLYIRKDKSKTKLFNSRSVTRREYNNLITNSCEYVKNNATELGENQIEVVLDNHPAITMLQKPNQYFNGIDMQVLRFLYYQIFGNYFILKVKDGENITSLWPLPSQYVYILRGFEKSDEQNAIWGYRFTGNKSWDFESQYVIHGRRPNIKGNIYYGSGIVEEAWPAIQLHDIKRNMDVGVTGKQFLNPSIIFSSDVKNQTAAEDFKNDLLNKLSNPNAYGIILSGLDPEKTKVENLSTNLNASILGTPPEILKELAFQFSVPLSFIDSRETTYASATVNNNEYYKRAIIPLLQMDEAVLNSQYLPDWGIQEDAFIAYPDITEIDQEQQIKKNEHIIILMEKGLLTPKEAQEKIQY